MASLNTDAQKASYNTFSINDSGRDVLTETNDFARPNEAHGNLTMADHQPSGQIPETGATPPPDISEEEQTEILLSKVKQKARPIWRWGLVVWTLTCVSLAINHVAAYICLMIPVCIITLVLWVMSLGSPYSEADLKMVRIQAYKRRMTGPIRPLRQNGWSAVQTAFFRSAVGYSIGLSCFGFVGMHLSRGKDWGQWMLSLSEQDLSPRVALWIWFSGFAFLGVLVVVMIVLFAFARLIYINVAKDPQPVTGPPQLPTVVDFPSPAIDCALTYNALFLCYTGVFMFMANEYETMQWVCLAGLVLGFIWFWWRWIRFELRKEQVQLCHDWATDVDCTEPDPRVTEMLAYHEEVTNKRAISLIPFAVVAIGSHFVTLDSLAENHPQIAVLVVVCMFALLNFCLWAAWRRRSSGVPVSLS